MAPLLAVEFIAGVHQFHFGTGNLLACAGPRRALRAGLWGVGRSIRSDEGAPAARVHRTLEDTPFYMRSMVSQRLLGEDVIAMHETLYVPRLRSGLVRLMLPWRMPRLR